MKKLTPDYYKKPLSTFLFEQDEDEAADEEEPEEEAADEEEAEEEEGEEAEEGEEEPEEPAPEADSIDADLEALFIDFETEARKNAAEEMSESLSLKMLFEVEEVEEIDLDVFSAEVARLVKNYENLLDMEQIIVSKANEFIISRYGEDLGRDLLDKLESQHDIEIPDVQIPPETDLEVPLAVGAQPGGGE